MQLDGRRMGGWMSPSYKRSSIISFRPNQTEQTSDPSSTAIPDTSFYLVTVSTSTRAVSSECPVIGSSARTLPDRVPPPTDAPTSGVQLARIGCRLLVSDKSIKQPYPYCSAISCSRDFSQSETLQVVSHGKLNHNSFDAKVQILLGKMHFPLENE